MKTKIFMLTQDDTERSNRGASIVRGPVNADLIKLTAEYRKRKNKDTKMYEYQDHETCDTASFASWLVVKKGFLDVKYHSFCIDQDKIDEKVDEAQRIRNDPNTPKTMKEVKTLIAQYKKKMKKPKVEQADCPEWRTLGWVVYDTASKEDNSNAYMIYLPLEWLEG